MFPTGLEIAARTKVAIEEMEKFARAEFNLPNFSVDFKLTGKSDRGWCRNVAGRPYMQLGVQSLLTKPVLAWIEYKSFNYYMEVGGFKTNDWRLWLDTLIAHEMSHAIQFVLIRNAMRDGVMHIPGLGRPQNNHSPFFLAIYKRVRNRFVNSRLTRADYTGPRKAFEEPETKLAEIAAGDPLQGIIVQFSSGKRFEVIGKDPSIRGIYNYRAKNLATGQLTRLKLTDIMLCSEEAKKRVAGNDQLVAETFIAAAKQQSRARATATRRARRRYGW